MKTVIIFKERLQKLRKEAGLQQKELAVQIGMSANAISMMETGNRETTFEKLVALAEFFHVSTDYLLGITDDPTCREPETASSGQDQALSKAHQKALARLEKLDDHQAKAVLAFINSLEDIEKILTGGPAWRDE